ncbi:MAG: nitrite/sulfite reductase [Dehalococcoidia bacterium]|nr:nitrite/sulfite reductase [Dehalococcoidia bacterium]
MTTKTQKPRWTPNPDGQRVLPVIPEEIEDFERQVQRFRSGEFEEAEFMAFRLKQGIYGQRQPDEQMVRVKIPFGGLTADQMDVLGKIAAEYAPLNKGHVTTRENVQYHHVLLDDTPEIMRILGDVGLTTREACGNTIRNITGSPNAGVAIDEVFDPTPYAGAFARYFLRHELSGGMPRKIKTSFSGGLSDEAVAGIHDFGYISKIKDGEKGFKLVVGGGLAIFPKEAPVLYDWVSLDDYLHIAEAALRIFNRSDEERKSRMKARMKFTVDRLGIDEFRRQIEEELEGDWKQPIDLDALLWTEDEFADAPQADAEALAEVSFDDASDEFREWKRTNVVPQKQDGYNMVHIVLQRGDLWAHQWSPLAEIVREFAGGRVRMDIQQNVVMRWVRTESLLKVYDRLVELDLARGGRHTITDVVTCPGTDSCKLGITSSMGLNKALTDFLDTYDTSDPLVEQIHIKASGCPNSCGQHHIADIGFHGAVIKGKGGQVPAYELFLGGDYEIGDGRVDMGTRIKARIPAKRAPEVLKGLLDKYQAEREDGEVFKSYTKRMGTGYFEEYLADFRDVGPLDRDHIQNYMDWDKTILYVLERGEGECAV